MCPTPFNIGREQGAENLAVFAGRRRAPSTTIGAVILLCRKAATNVIFSQAPSGTVAITLTPRGAHPRSRLKFVLTAVSSINTSRARSKKRSASNVGALAPHQLAAVRQPAGFFV